MTINTPSPSGSQPRLRRSLTIVEVLLYGFVSLSSIVIGLWAGLFVASRAALPPEASMLLLIVLGGVLGGFTLALAGGEEFGLRFPGTAAGSRWSPGFLGDIFVGAMSATTIFGVGAGVADMAPLAVPPDASIWAIGLRNFALAYLAGFLGINLIRSLSKQVLDKQAITERLAEVGRKVEDAEIMLGYKAIDEGQLDVAETYMCRAIESEGNKSIRAHCGLAMVHRRKERIGEAIQRVSIAIEKQAIETEPSRVALAYFNRASYYAYAINDSNRAAYVQNCIADLKQSFTKTPTLHLDVPAEPDFAKAWQSPEFVQFMEGYSVAPPKRS